MCAHNRKLESQEGCECVLRYRKWNHRRVWVCAHNRKLESQEGLGGAGSPDADVLLLRAVPSGPGHAVGEVLVLRGP